MFRTCFYALDRYPQAGISCPRRQKLITRHLARMLGNWLHPHSHGSLLQRSHFSVVEPQCPIVKAGPYKLGVWREYHRLNRIWIGVRIRCSPLFITSHSQTVSSQEPDASSRSSNDKATDRTELVWPSRVCYSTPVSVFCRRMVLSYEQETSTWPLGAKASPSTEPECLSSTYKLALKVSSTCSQRYT